MENIFSTVIFDLDGTLADTLQDVGNAINESLRHLGFPPLSIEQIRKAIGPGKDTFIQRIFPDVENPDYSSFIRYFREVYWDHCLDRTRLFDGIISVLERLKDCGLGVASNKPRRFSEKILQGLGVRDRFQTVLGPEDVKHSKPHPEMVTKAIEVLGGRPSKTLFVGDTDHDMLAGRDAGVRICAVRYGYGEWESLRRQKPDFIANSPAEVIDIIDNHFFIEDESPER